MAGTTTKGFRYPANGDAPNVAVDCGGYVLACQFDRLCVRNGFDFRFI